MQYRQRKLHRSVTDMRRSLSGRCRVSVSMSTDASAFREFLGKAHEEALEFLRRVSVLDGTLLVDHAFAEL